MQVIRFAHAVRYCKIDKSIWTDLRAYKRGIGYRQSLIATPVWVVGLNDVLFVRRILEVPVGTMQIPGFSDLTIR